MSIGVDVEFKKIPCKTCSSTRQYAILKSNRWGIYCSDCGNFIKWANKGQTIIINARREYLKKYYHNGERRCESDKS